MKKCNATKFLFFCCTYLVVIHYYCILISTAIALQATAHAAIAYMAHAPLAVRNHSAGRTCGTFATSWRAPSEVARQAAAR